MSEMKSESIQNRIEDGVTWTKMDIQPTQYTQRKSAI